jgi:nucleoside-diphosphate-sugar epimerase
LKVTVTGATGFIGSHLIDRLLSRDNEVTALVRNDRSAQPLRDRKVSVVMGSIEDSDTVHRAIAGSDVVFNLARAKSHGSRPMSEVTATNVAGARNVARAAKTAGAHFIHASSTAIYGSSPQKLPADEDSPHRPDSAYARSKLEGERAVRDECPNATITRISAVLGPGCHNWLPLFRSAASGTLRLVGDGRNLHHPVDVADVVEALMLCATTESARRRTFNIAGPDTVTIARLVELMSSAFGTGKTQPRPLPQIASRAYLATGKACDAIFGFRIPRIESVMFLTAHREFDISRARREIGFNPAISVDDAVRRTSEFYKSERL